eukprot:Selendium_serpulae@DN509_c0_g1_i1.p1
MDVLVGDLIVTEVWKRRVMPAVDAERYGVERYLIAFHEAALLNLLEVLLFHPEAVAALGTAAASDLVSYLGRKMTRLVATDYSHDDSSPSDRDPLTELELGLRLSALSVSRLAAERLDRLPVSAVCRFVTDIDALMLLIAVLDAEPWVRRRKTKVTAVYHDNKWEAPEALGDSRALPQMKVQVMD